MTGALIGAIVRDGTAIFPHGDDVLQPGDRVIVFTESSRVGRGRARAVTRAPALRRRARREAIGVDVARGARTSSARSSSTSASRSSLPARVALGYAERRGPFLGAGAIAFARRLGARAAARGGTERVGAREGFLVVSLTWLLAAGVGALPYSARGEAQLSSPLDAYFESMSGFTTTGARSLTDVEALSPARCSSGASSRRGSAGWGSSCSRSPCCRACASAAASSSSRRCPGPRSSADGADPRHRPAPLAALRRAHGRSLVGRPRGLRLDRDRRRDDALRGGRARVRRRCRPAASRPRRARSRRSRAAIQWTIVRLHGRRAGRTSRSCTGRSSGGARASLVRDEEFRLYLVLLVPSRSRVIAVELVGDGTLRGRGGRPARRLPGRLDDDDDRLRERRLQPVDALLALVTLVGLMFVGGSAGSTTGSIKVVRHLLSGRSCGASSTRPSTRSSSAASGSTAHAVDERTLRAVIVLRPALRRHLRVGTLLLVLDADAGRPRPADCIDAIAAAATTLGNVGPASGSPGRWARSSRTATSRRS